MIFFTVFGICLVAIAVALNVSWVLLNWRMGVLAVLGVVLFLLVIAGMVLNTIFLVREIRRNEQHDSFINAVTHELKTPVASIRLYLQTLQTRDLDRAKRDEFYRIMLEDSDRLLHTIDQVLRAGATGSILRRTAKVRLDLSVIARECVELARTRFHLAPEALQFVDHTRSAIVLGDSDELKAAVWNLLDNAVKYSQGDPRILVELDELHDQRIAVRVTDNGVGISAAELKRIFKRFYRIPASVAVRTKGSGLGLFIVEAATDGVLTQPEPAIGLRAAGTAMLKLDGVRVPGGALLAEGSPDAYAECIRLGRIAWCAMSVGTAQGALDFLIPYVKDRKAFGEPIAHRQAVAFNMSNIAIEVEGMRLTTYRAASLADQGKDFAREAAIARHLCATKGNQIGSDSVQLLGGHGYVKEYPVERWYRDLRSAGVIEGGLLV